MSCQSCTEMQGQSSKHLVQSIIPLELKVWVSFTFALTAVLATLTALTAKGIVPLNLTALYGSVGTLGVYQALSLPLLTIYYCNEKTAIEQNGRLYREVTRQPINSLPLMVALQEEEWKERLKSAPSVPLVGQPMYNLNEMGKAIAINCNFGNSALPQLPLFGKYDLIEDSYNVESILLGVRLPPYFLAHTFPKELHAWLSPSQNTENDCFLFVFDNRKKKKDPQRNLALHAMAMLGDNKVEKDLSTGGSKKKIQIKLFKPYGIDPPQNGVDILNGESKNSTMLLQIHHGRLSPDNCRVTISSGSSVSSAYFAAQWDNQRVAFYALFLNSDEGEESLLLQDAVQQNSVHAILETLKSHAFFNETQAIFQHPGTSLEA